MYVHTNETPILTNSYMVTMLVQMSFEEARVLHRCLQDYHPIDSNEAKLKDTIENELYLSIETIKDYVLLYE